MTRESRSVLTLIDLLPYESSEPGYQIPPTL
jgi:hypothetical protein